ncbi:hypothetical protein PSC67_01775 [Fusobacterium nucleatum]|nr:hypothetical protein [Fusobacterium nucleatum]WDF25234.1 hypothetical protein PSC67_01775 [Fusobacterium nucleatum]
MLYISHKNNLTDNIDDERKKKVIEFLENILLDKKIEKIIIQDPYLYGDNFYEIFITKTKEITDLNIEELGIWDNLLYKISDLDEDEKEKNIKIVSTKKDGIGDITSKIYKKMKFSIFLGKRNIRDFPLEEKIHDRLILLKTFDNIFSGIHIGISLNDIAKKEILLTTISEKISKELFCKLEKKFNQGENNNE